MSYRHPLGLPGLVLAGLAMGAALSARAPGWCAPTALASWREADVNGDDRFDQADLNEILAQGIAAPTLDANGDGKRGLQDAFALLVLLSTWDRSGNVAVTEEDVFHRLSIDNT